MKQFVQKFAHLAAGKLLLINIGVLIAIKFLVPLGGSGLATITESLTPIDIDSIIEQTNAARVAAKLSVLTHNSKLDQAAQDKLASMEKEGYFAHISPDGRQPWDFIRAGGYTFRAAGENLAKGFTDSTSVVTAWMQSPSHHANIVSPLYTDIGVAQKRVILDGFPTTLVVQMFASPSPTAPVAVPAPIKPQKITPNAPQQPQKVSTSSKIAPVPEPIRVVIPRAPATAELSRTAGSALSIYLTALIGALILALAVMETHRKAFWALAGNAALLALAVVLPTIPTVTHFIF